MKEIIAQFREWYDQRGWKKDAMVEWGALQAFIHQQQIINAKDGEIAELRKEVEVLESQVKLQDLLAKKRAGKE
jgi:hypothetical protein